MKRKIGTFIAILLIAVSMIYATYAIFASMTEDVRHTLEVFTNAPDSVKQGFNAAGWNFDSQVNSIVETTTARNQLGMTIIIIIEAFLTIMAMIAVLLSKD